MDRIILTDADGVLVNWNDAFDRFMLSKGYARVPDTDTEYSLAVRYNLPFHDVINLTKEFNESAWMGFLPALRDARSGVASLVENGYRFVCITSLSLDPMARRLRWMNLNDIFGRNVFLDLICLDTGADKDEALAPYKDSGLFWLEDKSENAVLGADLGLRSLIVDHAHNAELNDKRIVRLHKWSHISEYIIDCDK